jgi:plastocyanin
MAVLHDARGPTDRHPLACRRADGEEHRVKDPVGRLLGRSVRGPGIRALSVAVVGAALALAPGLSVSAAEPQTFQVSVDGHSAENQTAFLSYFPHELSAHPGDTVEFDLADSGEPHTVTFSTLLDAGLAAEAAGADPATEPNMAKLPVLLPDGPGDANQVAANPCYVASGDIPVDPATACPTAEQPALDGTQTFFNSGWMGPDTPFTVTLSPDIKPGTYHYFCLLHREGMVGTLTVVDPATEVKSPGDATAEGETQIADTVAKLAPAVEAANAAPPAMAGTASPDVQDALSTAFFPGTVSIPVGGSVSWTIIGPHTISFNAPQSATNIRVEAPDGTVHLNPAAAAPSGGPGAPPPPSTAPDPSVPIVIDAGTWDGTGFLSSGILVSFPPGPFYQYKVTFSTAGTYKVVCLIHTDMQGTVKVG